MSTLIYSVTKYIMDMIMILLNINFNTTESKGNDIKYNIRNIIQSNIRNKCNYTTVYNIIEQCELIPDIFHWYLFLIAIISGTFLTITLIICCFICR